MIPAKIVRTGGPSVELELSSLELFCFAPVLVESGFWCSVCKPIESSKQRNFLAAGSGSLYVNTVRSERHLGGCITLFIDKLLKMNSQFAMHKAIYAHKRISANIGAKHP